MLRRISVWLNQAKNYLHCNAAKVGPSLSSSVAVVSQTLKNHHLDLHIASGNSGGGKVGLTFCHLPDFNSPGIIIFLL